MPVTFGYYSSTAGEPYVYHLTYVASTRGIVWHAIVRQPSGTLAGTAMGRLDGVSLANPELETRLAAAVHAAIEGGLDRGPGAM